MAPSRKSRSGIKRFSYINEVSPNKHGGENANKSMQKKRKLTEMLGPQWSKQELERFYEAYRKYGKDWKKVATLVRNRSAEMVEALYSMNRAYLSLPDGTASVVGLVAMMTDHYCLLGGSDSEQESNEAGGDSPEPQKRARGKFQKRSHKESDGHVPDLSQSHSVASDNGCLSLLKKRRSGIIPHAVRKRTPRVAVSYSDKDNREKYFSPAKKKLQISMDANDDVAHEIAMALTEASQRSGSPQVARMPSRKAEAATPSPLQDGRRKCAGQEMISTKLHSTDFHDGGSELSLGSTEADNGEYHREKNYLMGREGAGTVEFQEKGKNSYVKKLEVEDGVNDHFDDIKEASSGTEEQKLNAVKGKIQTEVVNVKSPRFLSKGPRKRSRKSLFAGDEDSPFDALQTLADLSSMMPTTIADTESSPKDKAENFDCVSRSKLKGNHAVSAIEDTALRSSKLGKAKAGAHESNSGIQKRRQKSVPLKLQINENEAQADYNLIDNQKTEAIDETKKFVCKGKRTSHNSANLQRKLVKPFDLTSSYTNSKREVNDSVLLTNEVPSANQLNLPTKARSGWKMDKQKPLITKGSKFSEKISDGQPDISVRLLRDKELNPKERLSNFLFRYQARRWCAFEWFYSAIDYPWFAKSEFVEYLNHVGLGHVPSLTRVEWGVIRSSLGRPRRFSEHFLREEKQKLNQYRESVRTHYAELHAGSGEGLPTDLARPLSVKQRVIAIHPRTRELHDGTVLTVDASRYHVQFDRPDLGVEYVMDIDCMPSNPMENMPASFTRHNFIVNSFFENLKELKINEQLKEGNTDEYVKVASSENLDNIMSHHISPSTYDIGKLLKHREIQGREADIQALSELTRALDKKEAVILELKRMNDEVLEKQKDGDSFFKNSEAFQKLYAAVLWQLQEVNEQVSSALYCLRKRNTYQEIFSVMSSKPVASLNGPDGLLNSLGFSAYNTQECGYQVAEIVENSRIRARRVVGAAMQAISSLEKMGKKLEGIEQAIDFVNNQLSQEEFDAPAVRSFTNKDTVKASSGQSPAGASTQLANSHTPDTKLASPSNQNEPKIPSELIAHCVAALLMIQKCTERHFPPAEVAQVLDSALTSLQPLCSHNLSVYEEIQKFMGIIRTQILALIPS